MQDCDALRSGGGKEICKQFGKFTVQKIIHTWKAFKTCLFCMSEHPSRLTARSNHAVLRESSKTSTATSQTLQAFTGIIVRKILSKYGLLGRITMRNLYSMTPISSYCTDETIHSATFVES